MSQENPYTAPSTDSEISNDPSNPAPGPHNYASRVDRFLGALIDGLIIIVPAFGMGFVLGILAPDLVTSAPGKLLGGLFGLVITIAIQFHFWKTRSQSIGKIVMKTQIVDLQGKPADISTIILKRVIPLGICGVLPKIGFLISIVNGLAIFRAEHNCLHDDIAGTRVIKLSS